MAERDDPETEIALTRAAPETPLAWSDDADDDELETMLREQFDLEDFDDDELDGDGDDNATFWLVTYVAVLIAVVVALFGLLGYTLTLPKAGPGDGTEPGPVTSTVAAPAPIPSSPDDSVVPSTTEPTPPPAVAAPPPVSTEAPAPPRSTPNPNADSEFLNSLNRAGIAVGDVPTAIRGGRDVCRYIDEGHTPLQTTQKVQQNAPTLSLSEANIYVTAAVESFCPQAGR